MKSRAILRWIAVAPFGATVVGCGQQSEAAEPLGQTPHAVVHEEGTVGKTDPTDLKANVEEFPQVTDDVSVHPLNQVVSIIEATVERVWYEYDEALGPRTFVSLKDMSVHAGRRMKNTFSQLGGPLPDGRRLASSHLLEFTPGARYVLFFGRQATVYSPLWYNLAFRIEENAERKFVLGSDGFPVRRFDRHGVKYGRTSLLEDHMQADGRTEETLRKSLATDAALEGSVAPAGFIDQAIATALEVEAPLGEEALDVPIGTNWRVSETVRSTN